MSTLGQRLKAGLRRAYGRWLRLAPGSHIAVSGPSHRLVWNDARLHGCQITITGEDNSLEIGAGAILWRTHIQLTGRHLICRIGARTRLRGGTLNLTDDSSRLEIGADTTIMGAMIVAQGGRSVILGQDCMLAYGADIRCSDSHGIVEQASGRHLNPAADVCIGNHVWLGIHSQVLKGTTIADDAIVAARAVVTQPVHAGTIVAGNPAKPIRAGVTWQRSAFPAA